MLLAAPTSHAEEVARGRHKSESKPSATTREPKSRQPWLPCVKVPCSSSEGLVVNKWKQWWPYKAAILLTVFLVAGANGLIQVSQAVDEVMDNETWGVGAAVFALSTALFLFITRLPEDNSTQDTTISALSHALGVVTAFCAGMLWLLDETSGNPSGYLILLLGVTGFLALAFVLVAIFEWMKERRNGTAER